MHTIDRVISALATHFVLGIDDLRAMLGNPADLNAVLFALESEGRVILFKDCDPSSIPPARRKLLLTEGAHVFTTCSLR